MILTRPVIRAGDRLVVEENTAVIEARLEAVALGPAALGSSFDVRLKLGGKVARAVALAPGRAAFQAHAEVRQ
jgi:flagella basal body P-ring formation protein FlgA